MSSTADDAVEDGSTDDRQKTQVDESSEIDKSPNLKADNEEPIGQVEEVLASNGISRSEDIPENMALETPADENRDSPGAAGQGNQASENSEVHQDSKNDRRGSRTSQTSEKNDRRGSRTSQKGEVQQISAERNGSNVDGRRQSQTSQKSQGKQHAALHTDAKESHKGAVRRSPTGETSQKSEIFDTANQSDRNSDSGEKSEVFDGTASVKTKTEYRRDSQISEKSEVHIDSALVGDESAMASPEDYRTKRFEKADDLDPEEQVDHTVLGAPEASLVKRIEVADEIDAVDDAPEEVAKQRETQESGVTVGLAWPTINDERASSDGEKDGSNNGDDRADDAARNIGENNTDPSNDRFTVKRTSVAKRNSVTSKDTRRTSHVVKARTFCEEVKGGVPQKKRTLWGRVMGESPPKNDAPKKSFFNFGKSQVKAQSDSNNPPGSVSITIVGTEGFPNLKKKQKSTRHCVCDVIGSKSGPFKTPKVENVANPTWNHPVRVLNYHRMSCIQFAIIDDDIIGLGCLNTSDFYPNGFKGSLDLRDNDDKPIKAKLKLIVNAKPPLKGEGENEDGGQGGFQDEVSDQIMAKFTCADDHGPNDFLTRSANRRARVVHVTSDAEEEDVDALLRTPISSEFEESSEDNREDADVEKDRCTLDANEDDEDEETLKARNRAACNIAGMELRGHREETDPLRGLPYHLGSRGWEPHLVWVCGQKVKPANFSDAVHKQLALAALSAGTTSVQAKIKRLRGAREGGWQLRWDCAASCKVDGPAPRRVNDKFTTKRVTNTPMPTWNEQCDFPDVMQDATLEFAVEGIDRDGWPKRDAILGRIGLPKESIGDQGFDGELKLQGTKHGVDANLQVEIAVLALWDDEADERVPLHETRAALQRMDDIWSKSWAAPLDLEDDSRNYGPEENTWEELDLGPCTVYDLLYADAHRRKCHKKLNNDIDVIKVTSPVKKKEWVWKEVQNFFTRIYDDEDSVKKSLDVAPVPMVAKDPRPHLSCVSHPDDAAASHHDLGNVELANIRPEKLIRKDFSSSSEESEEWENGSSSSSSSSSSSNSRSRKRANIRAGGAKRISPVFEKTLQQLAEKQRMSQGKEMNASRRQTHQQTRNANSTIEEQIRRATHHGPTSRYKETRPLLQAKGIRPSELANHDSTSSAEELEPGTRSLDIAEARGRHANTTKKVVNARSAVAPKANNLKQQKTLRSRMEEQRIEIGTDGNNISHVTSARPNQPRSHQALDVIDESALLGHVPRLSEINMDLDIKCVDMDGRPDRDRRINTALVLDTEVAPHSVKEVVRTFQPGKMGFANRGAIVEKVHAGGQAEREGVKVGWRIIKVGDQACETFDDKAFQDAKAGDIPFQVTFVKGSVKVEDAGKGSPIANKDKQLNTRGHTSTQLKVLKDMLEIQEELSPRPDTLEVTESPQSSEKSPKEKKNKKDKRVATDSSESPNEKKTKKEKKEKKSKKQDDEAEEENQYYAEPDHRAREDDAEDEALQEKKNKKDKKEKKTKKEYSSPDEKEVKKEKKSRKDKKEKRNEGLAGGAVVVGARIDTGLGPHSRASVARQSMPGTRQSVAQRQSVTASRQSIRQSVSAQRNSVAAAPQATKLKSPQRQSLTAARQSATTQKVISPSTQSLGRSATAPLRPSANTPRQSITTRGTTQFTYPVYRSSVKSITQDSDGFLEL